MVSPDVRAGGRAVVVRSASFTGSLPCRAARPVGRAATRPIPAGAAPLRGGLPRPAPGIIRRAFERLSEEQRTALRLVNVDRLSYQEAAQRLGITRELFAERLIRARQSLARALADPAVS